MAPDCFRLSSLARHHDKLKRAPIVHIHIGESAYCWGPIHDSKNENLPRGAYRFARKVFIMIE
jgi:hypothetical protein